MKKFFYLIGALWLTGCASFQYGKNFTEPVMSEAEATVVLYRKGIVANQVPLDVAIDGKIVTALNPKGFKVVRLSGSGEHLFNTVSGPVDLRRRYTLEAGKVHYMRVYCYSIVFAGSFCRVDSVAPEVALPEVRQLSESLGTAPSD